MSKYYFAVFCVIMHSSYGLLPGLKCDRTCKAADKKTACWPSPCPEVYCNAPVFTPGDCCLHCPIPSCNRTCIAGNRTVCWPVPCPKPPCSNPVLIDDDCCERCPDPKCPFPCTQGGHHFCEPPPCPPPPCSIMYTRPGECCPYCPYGPACDKDGVVIPYNQSVILHGKNCTCTMPFSQDGVNCV